MGVRALGLEVPWGVGPLGLEVPWGWELFLVLSLKFPMCVSWPHLNTVHVPQIPVP